MRIRHCLNALSRCIKINGDVVECGVSSGANFFPMADFVKTYNKENKGSKIAYACDTFSGLPYDDFYKEGHHKGEFNYGLNFKGIQALRQDLPIERIEGDISQTLTNQNKRMAENSYCFVFLDLDLYIATKQALNFFLPRISIGGIIGLHDYGWHKCQGVQKAVEEEIKENYKQIFLRDYTIFFRRIS